MTELKNSFELRLKPTIDLNEVKEKDEFFLYLKNLDVVLNLLCANHHELVM